MASMPCSAIRLGDQRLVAEIALRRSVTLGGNRVAKPGREIVEHHDRLAGVEQRQHHVAADIAGAAGDQNRHVAPLHRRVAVVDATVAGTCQPSSTRIGCAIRLDRSDDLEPRRSLERYSRPASACKGPVDETHPQSRFPRRRSRHALSAGHEVRAEGDDDRGRPAGAPACGRRGQGSRHRAFHLRHRPQQGA